MTTTDVLVGPVSSFRGDGSRQLIKFGPDKRNIVVFYLKQSNSFFAMDNACYHHGAPLHKGDIEDMGGHMCVVCPWHSYRIALDTGEGMYMGINTGDKQPVVRSKGIKQRTHHAEARSDGNVWVTVDTETGKFESDSYAKMPIANQENTSKKPSSVQNYSKIHSGFNSLGGISGTAGRIPRSGEIFKGRCSLLASHSDDSIESIGGSLLLSNSDHVTVQCVGRDTVSADGSVVALHFEIVDGCKAQPPTLKPGMWITLEFSLSPIKEGKESISGTICGFGKGSSPPTTQGTSDDNEPTSDSIKGSTWSSRKLMRTYTIIASKNGRRNRMLDKANVKRNSMLDQKICNSSWFTIAVKNMHASPRTLAQARYEGKGSKWMHEEAFCPPTSSPTLAVVDHGGMFSIAMNRSLISTRKGRVLLITGGIGITPILASIREMLTDDFIKTSGPALYILHIHVDTKMEAVPFLPELLKYRREFKDSVIGKDPVTYELRLFLTQERIPPALIDGIASVEEYVKKNMPLHCKPLTAALSLSEFSVVPQAPTPTPKGRVSLAALLAADSKASCLPKNNSATNTAPSLLISQELYEMIQFPPKNHSNWKLSELSCPSQITFGRRPTYNDLFAFDEHDSEGNSFVGRALMTGQQSNPHLVVAMLCGPEGFVNSTERMCQDAGVPANSILLERFDF